MVELSKENKSDCFFERYGTDFDSYYKDESITRISSKAASRFTHCFNPDEVESIRAEWLWHAIRKFDKEKFPNTKFSSYLFGQVVYGFRIALKNKQRESRKSQRHETSYIPESKGWIHLHPRHLRTDVISSVVNMEKCKKTSESHRRAKDFLMDLPKDIRSILELRYIHNMTMDEIGALNGYSRETARRKINSAIDFCKSSN